MKLVPFKSRAFKWRLAAVVAAVALGAAACSSEGGRETDEQSATDDVDMTIAMITHAPSGDTFWDIIRKGAEDAADNYGVDFEYSNSIEISEQATLIQNAVDRGVDGIAVSNPNPDALNPAIQEAIDAGIPVVEFNAGVDNWQDSGALMFFGQNETVSGQAAGERLKTEGAGKVLCVLQAQGQVQLEARCDGVIAGFGGDTEKLYVDGEDMTSVQSTLEAKLREDPSITHVMTLGAPIAMTAIQSVDAAGSEAQVATFDLNGEVVGAIQDGGLLWAIDQQPYLQGFHSVNGLVLYATNGNTLGGGEAVLTGPSFVDPTNVDAVAEYAERGTR